MASDPDVPGPLNVTVAGAGNIGCFVGGLLAAGGHRVTLLGRARVLDEIAAHGLTLTDFSGLSARVGADRLTLATDPACLASGGLVLVTVKSTATAGMGALIAAHAPASAPVVSLQNGLENAGLLRAVLPGRDVRGGMVPFNVVPAGPGHWHRSTSGEIVIGAGPGALARRLSVPGLPVSESDRIEAIQWGKLLLNLNNALNALSGLPLHAQLMDRDWRRLMAGQMAEALAVLRAAGIAVKSPTPLPLWAGPVVLRLPTPLFTRIAAQALTIDPSARTSMAHDLAQGRPTEIDSLQGKIIELGREWGIPTPVSNRVAALIRAAEAAGPEAMRPLTPDEVRAPV